MSRRHLRSFRGLHALVEHPPGRDLTVLKNQLEFLGLGVTVGNGTSPSQCQSADILFFDADQGYAVEHEEALRSLDLPVVAVIGSETPSRLEAMLACEPSAYLVKPVRPTGIYSSIAIAMHQFAALRLLRHRLGAAEERLRSRRILFSAVLRVMHEARVGEVEAFRILQRAAMSRRLTIEALSAGFLAGEFALPCPLSGQPSLTGRGRAGTPGANP
jgi:AmiR/NasT family two-component response regulator